ncbi:MAG: hypothetical protein AAFU03_05630, partial [Bacteroidota bacterium]
MCSQSFHANHPLLIGFLLVLIIGCQNQSINDNLGQAPPSPFTELDTIAANDWWNRKWNPIINVKVSRDSVIAFAAYTVANGTLKLSAQLYPLYPNESPMVHLELERDGEWVRVQSEEVNPIGWSTLFRVE